MLQRIANVITNLKAVLNEDFPLLIINPSFYMKYLERITTPQNNLYIEK